MVKHKTQHTTIIDLTYLDSASLDVRDLTVTMMLKVLLSLLVLPTLAEADVLSLDVNNYENLTVGRTVFIKVSTILEQNSTVAYNIILTDFCFFILFAGVMYFSSLPRGRCFVKLLHVVMITCQQISVIATRWCRPMMMLCCNCRKSPMSRTHRLSCCFHPFKLF